MSTEILSEKNPDEYNENIESTKRKGIFLSKCDEYQYSNESNHFAEFTEDLDKYWRFFQLNHGKLATRIQSVQSDEQIEFN